MKKIAVSGGFDPIHIGHLRLFKEAKKLGDNLIVILNTDRFLKNKKGYIFMPFKERKELIEGFEVVDKVVRCIDKDQSVKETLREVNPDMFVNGGDRKEGNIPEEKVCKENNIELKFNVGGDKIQSSSWLVNDVVKKLK